MHICTMYLNQTAINLRLAVPNSFISKLGIVNCRKNHSVDLQMKDSTERVWRFRCLTRFTATGNHPKSYLSSGWLDFIRTKGLKINDKVSFYKEDEATGAQYRIKVERNVFPLMGQAIWVDVELLNNGNIEGEQPDEEQQVLIGNTAAAETNPGNDEHVIFQQNRFEIEENRTNTGHHDQAHHRRHWLNTLEAKCNFGTGFAIINFLMEIPSAVLDEIASKEKPNYVLIVMLISLTSMLVCLVELVYKGRKEKITWRWSSGRRRPWFYYPPPSNRLFDHAAPIKFSVWPSIFAFGVLCSRFMGDPDDEDGESRTSDQDGGDVPLEQFWSR